MWASIMKPMPPKHRLLGVAVLGGDQLADPVGEILVVSHRDNHGAWGLLTPIIGLRLLALAAGLRHNAEIGQPGLCFSAYGHKFGINHLVGLGANRRRAGRVDGARQ
jgi:hypothetical protein